ncbi:MAG: hypothetical protein N4A31_00665 [Rickettsiales bacterium]|jgi:hypothetical protein|nr:hypothetical protein [Rickettsiales bacterium]
MINYVIKTMNTALDTFSLFVVSALPIEITYNKTSKKESDPLWHNITNNDPPPPPDDDAQGIEDPPEREEASSFFEVLRDALNPCLEQDQDAPPAINFDCVNDDAQHLQPVLLGSLLFSL